MPSIIVHELKTVMLLVSLIISAIDEEGDGCQLQAIITTDNMHAKSDVARLWHSLGHHYHLFASSGGWLKWRTHYNPKLGSGPMQCQVSTFVFKGVPEPCASRRSQSTTHDRGGWCHYWVVHLS